MNGSPLHLEVVSTVLWFAAGLVWGGLLVWVVV